MQTVEVNNMSFKPGMEFRVTGVPKSNQDGFSINVGHSDENIALHVNPRFDYGDDKRIIVLNSKKDGFWNEELKDRNFPFQSGQEFEVTITFSKDNFYINLHDGNMLQFPNRLGDKQYDHMFCEGNAVIHGIYIK
ncbi:hypothetical protein SKAU_G00120710 [Synaphobranchus kaupii]|uniref:Galectin n=1 Tax=Synaphobranchus kaupii TaxID=118154 RepID=A0A9Q1FP38_SYNKA|nr:hypothetical protein SKAU_G00120710 [Synaphobranchus kaupii]